MTEEAKRARAAYMREWRRRNPERTRQQRELYWQRRAERMAAGAAKVAENQAPEGVQA